MKTVTVEALEQAGYKDCEVLFTKVALAGGFGDVKPSHGGGLDIEGIADAEAKKAVAELLKKEGNKPNVSTNAG